jgi:hypothetical protein
MRKTQLDMLKSTSTVEGTLVENNIAAYKSVGCAAYEIINRIRDYSFVEGKPQNIDTLILYKPETVTSLSEYSALLSQVQQLNARYLKGNPALIAALISQSDQNAELAGLREELFQLKNKIRIDYENKYQSHAFETMTLTAKVEMFNTQRDLTNATASFNPLSLASPAGLIIDAALNVLALFKTDTSLKGTDVKAGNTELVSYLRGQLTALNVADAKHNVDIKFISPDSVVLGAAVTDGSGGGACGVGCSLMLNQLMTLSTNYNTAKGWLASVDKRRAEIIKKAEESNNKKEKENAVKITTKAFEGTEKTLSEDFDCVRFYLAGQMPTNAICKKKIDDYKAADVEVKKAAKTLADAQKIIDKAGADFDKAMHDSVNNITVLNSIAEAIVKKLGGTTATDKEPATAPRLLGDYLRTEVLYQQLNAGTGKKAFWLDLNIAATGGNQRKRSSPITDVFTRGPELKYSGGSVVSYRVINFDGEIVLAGTTWGYAPYQKAKSIGTFRCQGTRNSKINY